MVTTPSLEKAKAYFDLQLGREPCIQRSATGPFLTISRQCGTGASDLAEEIARRLNRMNTVEQPAWTVFDRNLVTRMLEDNKLSSALARYIPEDRVSEIKSSVGEIVGLHPSLWTMVHQTIALIRKLAQLGNAIVVGRGANFAAAAIAHGLHLRLVAPIDFRTERIVQREALTTIQADAYVRRTDQARRNYVRSFFNTDIDDPTAYDLVVNMAHFTTASAADLVVATLSSRGLVQRAIQSQM
jgi:cytidylate kinase